MIYLGKYGADGLSLARAREKCAEARRAIALGPVDKPVLAAARPERLGRCSTDVATGGDTSIG